MSHKILDKVLFTPGPLTCSLSVKQEMLRDLGSRDSEFIEIVKTVRNELLEIAGVNSADFASILLQGSGTYSVEAAIQTLVPRTAFARALLLVNGAYGRRMQMICEYLSIEADKLEFEEDEVIDVHELKAWLTRAEVPRYAVVCVVHCETSSGVVNPVTEIGETIRKLQPTAAFLVDAMSSFGAIPLDLQQSGVDFLVSSANKCLQGVPGFAFILARRKILSRCQGNARSLSFDLVAQHAGLEGNGQFRFTPPTHALLAFRQALKEFHLEGGVVGRAARYKKNCNIIHKGMTQLGFKTLLKKFSCDENYIITSYNFPDHPNFHFDEFYRRLSDKGQVIYPGKVTRAACFRIGHIGALGPEHMETLLNCVRTVLQDMNVNLPTS